MIQMLLIASAVRGDRQALEQLVRQYYDPVYRYIFYRVKHRETAEDLTQDVFVKLTQSIARYRPTASFSAYLYRIAHNTLVDYYRAAPPPEERDGERPARDPIEQAEDKLLVQSLLAALPPEQRECVVLYYFQGLTCPEIAQVLSIPAPTVKSRVRRGVERLRRWMEESP